MNRRRILLASLFAVAAGGLLPRTGLFPKTEAAAPPLGAGRTGDPSPVSPAAGLRRFAGPGGGTGAAAPAENPPASVRADYLFRDGGNERRPLARVTAAIVPPWPEGEGDAVEGGERGGFALELSISARDPRLSPPLGALGVAGENYLTSERLEVLLGEARASVRTSVQGEAGERTLSWGAFSKGDEARFRRRVFPSGEGFFREEIEPRARLESVRFRVTVPAPVNGETRRYRTLVWASGRERLAVEWEVEGGPPPAGPHGRVVGISQPDLKPPASAGPPPLYEYWSLGVCFLAPIFPTETAPSARSLP